MRFDFATAQQITFGAGTLSAITSAAPALGRRPLVVTGRNPSRVQRLLDLLSSAGLAATTVSIAREPSTEDITQAAAHARASNCDFVIGFGGGSALDAAKATAALLTNPGELHDYLEVVGRAQPLPHPAAPCIAIPTTAGTGSEVTRNAVLSAPQTPVGAAASSRPELHLPLRSSRVKVSLRSPHMLPRLALVDPELTYDLTPALTASTGLDALTQLIEPYVSSRANPLTDGLCVDGLRRAARSLRRAVENGSDPTAREDMALASLFGGLALANAGLGAVHGFAGPIGGMFPAPHGALCAALLPHVIETNLAALRSRAHDSASLGRYDELARIVTDQPHATASDLLHWIRRLVSDLRIPSLSSYGISHADFPAIVESAARASSMKANPLPLTPPELTNILAAAL
jgi:alcohol dehydrogenase class IV